MKHLHFTQSLESLQGGGLGSSTLALHRQLLARGESSLVCATHGNKPCQTDPRALQFRRRSPQALYFAPELWKRAPELVNDADIVHGHGLYVGTNWGFGRAARKQRKPLVYHVHGFFEPWILRRSRWKKRVAHWLFEDANFRHVCLWRALTSREADQIRARGIKVPVVVIPNGLNLDDFPLGADRSGELLETSRPAAKSENRLLFLGRIHPKKGLDLLLRAWAALAKERRGWSLTVAGPDEGGYLRAVKKLADELGLGSQIAFAGPVAGAGKHRLLRSADILILPSYSEGFPMTLLEAMACEVPVVATRACNFPDISAAETGWECDAAVDSVRGALQEALSEGEAARKQRGRNGRRLVENHYCWSNLVSQFVQACATCC